MHFLSVSTAYGSRCPVQSGGVEQNVQAKDRELALSQQELRQKVYRMAQTYYFHKFRGLLFHTTYVCINACAEGMAPKFLAKQLQFRNSHVHKQKQLRCKIHIVDLL